MSSEQTEKAGFGALLFSFLIPLVGIILFFSWKSTRPRAAKSAIKAALLSIGLYIVGGIIAAVIAATAVNNLGDAMEDAANQIDAYAEDYED